MSNAAKVEIPGTGDDGLGISYDESGDEWVLESFALGSHVHTAADVTVTPAGTIAATDVQTALEELATDYAAADTAHAGAANPHPGYLTEAEGDARYWQLSTDLATQVELDAHINDTTDAHDASAISFSAVGSIAATDVQAAIAEVASEYAAADSAHTAAGDPHSQYLTQAEGDARYWQLSTDLATQAELNAHESDTTSIHGIADTSDLLTRTTADAVTGARIEIGDGTDAWQFYGASAGPTVASKSGDPFQIGDDMNVSGTVTATGFTIGADTIAEYIRDTMGTALTAGDDIAITPNDGANTIEIDAVGVPNIAYGTSPPGSPAVGDFWLDTN